MSLTPRMQRRAYLEAAAALLDYRVQTTDLSWDEDRDIEQFVRVNIVAQLVVKADQLAPLLEEPTDK